MRLVDTSAWLEFLRRRGETNAKRAVAALLEAEAAAFTCPIRFELLVGVKAEEEADLAEALSLSRHVPFEAQDWPAAARWERQLRSQGLTIPRNDLFVATVAIRTGLSVVCRDPHFDLMSRSLSHRLKVEQI